VHASNVQLVVKNGSEYKSTRSMRVARVTGEEI
jgi:hypothetical protein